MTKLRTPFLIPFVLAMLAISATASFADDVQDRQTRLIVLPFDDFSGSETGESQVRLQFIRTAEAKGWHVVRDEEIERLLEEERVRYFDSLEDGVRGRILDAVGASAVVSGSLQTFRAGRNPIVALSARMVRANGTVMWGDVVGLSSEETEGAFGFGRKSTLGEVALDAVERIMHDFPKPGESSSRVELPPGAGFGKGPHVYTAPSTERGPLRICVLPFDNWSETPEAPRVLSELLTLRLAATKGFEVVEPAALRAAALDARIGTFRGITSEHLARIAPIVETPLFLIGSVYNYADAAGTRGSTPELELEFSLVDVRNGRVLWSTQHKRLGTDYAGFLLLGEVTNVVTLADRVVSEMIRSGEHGLSKEVREPASRHARLKGPPERRSQLDRTVPNGEKP